MSTPLNTPGSNGAASPWKVLVVAGRSLDGQTAARRAAVHITEMEVASVNAEGLEQLRAATEGHQVGAALVCDEAWATNQLRAAGIPVLHAYTEAVVPHVPLVDADLRMAHRPQWYEEEAGLPRGVIPVASFAPARRGWTGKGRGALVALGTGTADTDTVLASARDTLLPLLPSVAEAADGPVTVLTDGPVDALGELLGAVEGTTVLAATDAGLDELHSACRVFLATPTLAALTTARARNAPLTLLPALDDAQQNLLERVIKAAPVPVLDAPDTWAPAAGIEWAVADSDDDLSGAQRVARKLRQLVLAPV
ncbi:CGA synthase-related protein [Streptomyces violaceus]|uniref:CGA synthase-related protein n=1 Tax=Streptomyces violaceus TaxID=1936 RepID=UPI002E207B08|nr:CGA synthase-related protein [Streptomyces violaceus]